MFELLAKDPNTTSALAAVASAVAAVVALIAAVASAWIGYITLKSQRTHNILSVRPIPMITFADFEHAIRVKLRNHGSGPMLVKGLSARTATRQEPSLVELMPPLPAGITWTNFVGAVSNRSVLPGSEIILLELNGSIEDQAFVSLRESVRRALAPVVV